MNECAGFDKFCNVCGKYKIPINQRNISEETAKVYRQYFSFDIICDKPWAPTKICTTCDKQLHQWIKGEIDQMPFGVPMLWMEKEEHVRNECYACLNYKFGLNRKKASNLVYQETLYAQKPIEHSDAIPVPKRPSPTEDYVVPPSFETFETAGESRVSEYVPSHLTAACNHIEISQNRLDIMVRRYKLSQRQSILLASDLKKVNILAPDVRIYGAIGRHRRFTNFFTSINDNSFAYCKDILGLVTTLHGEYKAQDWRLFIDSSKSSLKAVLLHITNSKNSVPIALSTNTEENYKSLKNILTRIDYYAHNWKICADLKVITILRGMQTGYTKNMCFMCLWDTRYGGDQYAKWDWQLREDERLNRHNIVHEPLVHIENILLPPLHIKLGIVKNFIKALNPEGEAFKELKRIFPRLSRMKIKEGLCSSQMSICSIYFILNVIW